MFLSEHLPAKSKAKTKAKGKGKTTKGEEEDQVEEEAVLKAFAAANQEGALKTRPKGFAPEHKDMELLKLRNFTIGKKVDDGVFTSLEGGQEEVMRIVRAMVGFVSGFRFLLPYRYHFADGSVNKIQVTHLNRIVMPDPGDDDESDDE
jgi:hypothetical protein